MDDCLSCRIIGTGALIGVGSYAIVQSRPTAPGTLVQKRVLAGLGVGGSLAFRSTSYTNYPSFCRRGPRSVEPEEK